ncbi:MAG: DUF4249 family protein [Bacteroidetes bacterium]|nr:DUF4249 family protein [Bacteroidota bacterium]
MKNIGLFVLLLGLLACNLTKEVEIKLPEYATQPVVECYLEPGKPFRLLLSRSYAFFDPFGLDSSFIQKTIIQGASIRIEYNGNTVILPNIPSIEANPVKLFNYTATETVPATPGLEYTLHITLPDGGGEITGKTTMQTRVPIDSVVVSFSPNIDSLARALTYITDNQNTVDFYRRLLNYSTLDSMPVQDFLAPDRISTTPLIAFGTGYELKQGDTIFNTIYHIDKAYYDFIESIQLSIAANFNPFAQPASIKSNVSGSANPIGIFTSLVYDRDTTIVHK